MAKRDSLDTSTQMQDPVELMALVALISERSILKNVVLVSFTVLVFDHLIMFQDEIEYIWTRFSKGMAPINILFLLNRYFAILVLLIYLTDLFPESCVDSLVICGSQHSALVNAQFGVLLAFSMVTVLTAEAILALRVYAVYRQNKFVFGPLGLVWIVQLVLLPCIFMRRAKPLGIGHTTLNFGKFEGVLFIAPAIMFDTIVGILLVLSFYQKSGSYRKHMPLTKLIIRDGSLYFVVVFITNIIWLAIHLKYDSTDSDFVDLLSFTPLEIWSGCITTIMVGRITLNLKMYNPEDDIELTFAISGIRFRQTFTRASAVGPVAIPTITPEVDTKE